MQASKGRIQKILLITGNPGKEKEFQNLLTLDSISLSSCDLPIEEIQSLDILEIGRHKTHSAFSHQQLFKDADAILTDDTALSLEGLNGLPGPLIKWFLKALSPQGISELVQKKKPSARATCLLTLGLIHNQKIIQFVGERKGNIVPPRGEQGFGWDSIFQPLGSDLTYGEMNSVEKNRISHRTKAVGELKKWLQSEQE